MLNINSLLNPQPDTVDRFQSADNSCASPSRLHFPNNSSPAYTCSHKDIITSMPENRSHKVTKDAAVFLQGPHKGPVNFPPFECSELDESLDDERRQAISTHHQSFQVYPSGQNGEGFISDYVRHIPYSSEKSSFLNKTGRDAFDVFQYTFRVPGDSEKRTHVVMWDYRIGLVRITPFFKACKFSKTTPAKALTSNPGLKEISHSITGGDLAAQGYWMPYACARAICLTFCYSIRWALTPVFGPSFVTDCLHRDHADFGRFKVDVEIIRIATLEAQEWKSSDSCRSGTSPITLDRCGIPRSVPQEVLVVPQLRLNKTRPYFCAGSPFSPGDNDSNAESYTNARGATDSPQVSPKSTSALLHELGWASLDEAAQPLSSPHSTLMSPLHMSTEPHNLITVSWRAEAYDTEIPMNKLEAQKPDGNINNDPSTPAKIQTLSTHGMTTRHRSISQPLSSNHKITTEDPFPSMTAHTVPQLNESDLEAMDTDIVETNDIPLTRAPNPIPSLTPGTMSESGNAPLPTSPIGSCEMAERFSAEDVRAAHWLLNLNKRDQQLAATWLGPVAGRKRKAG